jgi:hypothetical protein
MTVDLPRARREGLRWNLMLALNNASYLGANENLLLTVAQSIYPDATQQELRRELDYLTKRELVALDKKPSGVWHAALTRYGIDIADYTIDCEPGIARPAKYW